MLSLEMLQKILEKPLEKKAGRNYGPPSGKTLIYFIDDINMPEVSFNLAYNDDYPSSNVKMIIDQNYYTPTYVEENSKNKVSI